jgi:hypothetical protein
VYIHNPARIHPFPDSHPACCAATLQYVDRASRRPGTFPNPCAPQFLVSMGPSWSLEYVPRWTDCGIQKQSCMLRAEASNRQSSNRHASVGALTARNGRPLPSWRSTCI